MYIQHNTWNSKHKANLLGASLCKATSRWANPGNIGPSTFSPSSWWGINTSGMTLCMESRLQPLNDDDIQSELCMGVHRLLKGIWTFCRTKKHNVHRFILKAVYTIGNNQRLAFTIGVSQHMHKITNLWKFELNRHRTCEIRMKEKTPLSHKVMCV